MLGLFASEKSIFYLLKSLEPDLCSGDHIVQHFKGERFWCFDGVQLDSRPQKHCNAWWKTRNTCQTFFIKYFELGISGCHCGIIGILQCGVYCSSCRHCVSSNIDINRKWILLRVKGLVHFKCNCTWATNIE